MIIACQLVDLALTRIKQVLQDDMEREHDSGATPLLLDMIDHLVHQTLIQMLAPRPEAKAFDAP
jgi:hypothetical protein